MIGAISEAAFRIEAIRKSNRSSYFSSPQMSFGTEPIPQMTGFALLFSIGPADELHPGIPPQQLAKLQMAMSKSVRIMRTQNWLGLPSPPELKEFGVYIPESRDECAEREPLQASVADEIAKRGIGKAAFDEVGGWRAATQVLAQEKRFIQACAEWADGELVSAHIGYKYDLLCTDDFANSAGSSVFEPQHRSWLSTKYGVKFITREELLESVK